MIQVTINLENEHALKDNLQGMFESLTTEQVQEIASKALFKYLTDVIDYEKEQYIKDKILLCRQNGLSGMYSHNNKSASDLKDMTDDAIVRLDNFRTQYLNNYKSSKESNLENIKEVINSELKTNIKKFVEENKDLSKLVEDKQKAIADNFEELVKGTMHSVGMELINSTIRNASMGANAFQNHTYLSDILQRNNLY